MGYFKNDVQLSSFEDICQFFNYRQERNIIRDDRENFTRTINDNGRTFHELLLDVITILCEEDTDSDAYKDAYTKIPPPLYGTGELRGLDLEALKKHLSGSSKAQDILKSVCNVTCQGRFLLSHEQAYEILLFCLLFAYVQKSPEKDDEDALREILNLKTLEEIVKELKATLPDADALYEELIAAACRTDLDYYEKVIAKWAKEDGEKSLGECIRSIGNPKNNNFDPNADFVSPACKNWLDKFNRALYKKVDRAFLLTMEELPPLTLPDLSTVFPATELDNPFRINIGMFFDSGNCPDDPYDTDRRFDRAERENILRVFQNHRDGLANGFELDYGKNGYKVKIVNDSTADIRFEGNTAITASISSIYRRQLSVEAHAAPIHKAVQTTLDEQLEALKGKQFEVLTDEQLEELKDKQFEVLTDEEFKDSAVEATDKPHGELTAEQLEALSDFDKEFEDFAEELELIDKLLLNY